MKVIKAIRFDKEEKQAVSKVIEMLNSVTDGEMEVLDEYLYDNNLPILDEMRDGLRKLFELEMEE